ncbi:hypothetical protein F2P56_003950 [Juglans regia]|uniref:Uncharacterized protein n=2 Tax=Juglans regia TaxID=51240 RepID=A0A833Y8B4_JUGRE|nr:uncharacterized protein LOC109011260 [Juglans regia]KAF5477300.1 hypothetical protein F2P56_003950 [Juglans regia]
MASRHLNQKSNYHARSNSLPSRPHPLILQCNEHLCRLVASDTTSSSPSSALRSKLSCLQDLHECVEKLLLLPQTQQAISQEHHDKWVEELFDGSLQLLDACTATKDAVIHTKECTRELQSNMRRRRGGDMGFEREVRKYLMSRKVVKKAVQKALKGMESKRADKNHENLAMVNTLREIEAATLNVFESLLSYITGSKLRSKSSSWSLVSKLVLPKRVACDNEDTERSELEMVDSALYSIVRERRSKSDDMVNVENVQNLLLKLEPNVQDLEEGLELLFRRLIKTRVSLLNTFNH